MTEKDIVAEIMKDNQKFNDSKWTGIKPPNFVETVKSIFRQIAPSELGIAFRYAKSLLTKKDEDLTLIDIRNLCNWSCKVIQADAITSSPFLHNEDLYDQYMLAVSDTIIEWSLVCEKFDKSQERKKENMISMLPQRPKKDLIIHSGR